MKKTNHRNVKSKVLLEEDASSHQQLNRPYRIGYFRAAFMYIGSKPMIVFHGGQRSIAPAAVSCKNSNCPVVTTVQSAHLSKSVVEVG